MTPAREAEIRRTVARIKAQAASGAWMSEGYHDQETLLAEIDRLRALPVLRTCGECGHAPSRLRPRPLCGNPALFDRPRPELLSIDHDAEPPARCPLRGADGSP